MWYCAAAVLAQSVLMVGAAEHTPYSHSYVLDAPLQRIVERHDTFSESHGVVGLATNGIPFILTHYGRDGNGYLAPRPLEREFDDCGGHGDGEGHYHYHMAPVCLLKKLGAAVPPSSTWWHGEDTSPQWPQQGGSVRVGTALDGAPIFSPYHPEDGRLLRSPAFDSESPLDECHGMRKGAEYAYFLTSTPPFLPPCLSHRPGVLRGFDSKGARCGAALPGCPDHAWFRGVTRDADARRLTCGACGANTTTTHHTCGACGAANTTQHTTTKMLTTTAVAKTASWSHRSSVPYVMVSLLGVACSA
jgi:hypothetical protein